MTAEPTARTPSTTDPDAAEHRIHAPSEHGPSYTAWHPLLAQVLTHVLSSPALEVHPFVKLGTLPLEADIILLRKNSEVDLLAQFPEFSFLLRFLRHYLLIEYKSPLDRLGVEDFDTARAYSMLCKRKYGLTEDRDVAIALLYSQVEPAFFAACRDNGYVFTESEMGIWASEGQPLRIYAVDLGAYGAKNPEHPINLFSKRYKAYRPTDPRWENLLQGIQSSIRREMQTMQTRLRGQYDLNMSVEEALESLLSRQPPERLLRHVPLDKLTEHLRGLPAEERLRGLPAEERLRGLSEADRQHLRELLDRVETEL